MLMNVLKPSPKIAALFKSVSAFEKELLTLWEEKSGRSADKEEIKKQAYSLFRFYNHGEKLKSDVTAGRVLFYLITDIAKTLFILEEIKLPEKKTYKILDLGCGGGSELCAFLLWLSSKSVNDAHLEIYGVDTDHAMLFWFKEIITRLAKRCGITVSLHPVHKDILRFSRREKFDVIFMVNALCELNGSAVQKAAHVKKISACLKEDGVFIVIEPALKNAARSFHEVRNVLMKEDGLYIVSPCFHAKDCPALKRERTYCYATAHFPLTPFAERIADALKLQRRELNFAYLVLSPMKVEHEENAFRIISHPLKTKGKVTYILCDEEQLKDVSFLKRDAPPEFHKWDVVGD